MLIFGTLAIRMEKLQYISTRSFEEMKLMDTSALRSNFHLPEVFVSGDVSGYYIAEDRMIVLGAVPLQRDLLLPVFHDFTKSAYLLERRELGIINVGGPGKVVADGEHYSMRTKDSLYIGVGVKDITFSSDDAHNPAKFYMNSAPAYQPCPIVHIPYENVEPLVAGQAENANFRKIYQCIIPGKVSSNQLVMGFTELQAGSIWNTMPPHVHLRRHEIYLYFNVPDHQMVVHLMGKPDETRHIIMRDGEAVYSPSWSIHSGAGTANYSFVWSMAGENQDYKDMDMVAVNEIK
ncbi:MAG: hypothetical protein RL335_1171 [Bacteroidota bacterium]|jgi:4-deoxy-L-threo-5-hexosulose-uronate ketol-isomerase